MAHISFAKVAPKNSTWLQGIGYVPGTPAGELKEGDTMLWNYGFESKVGKTIRETAKTITIEDIYVDPHSGETKIYERKLNKTRIVARPKSEL